MDFVCTECVRSGWDSNIANTEAKDSAEQAYRAYPNTNDVKNTSAAIVQSRFFGSSSSAQEGADDVKCMTCGRSMQINSITEYRLRASSVWQAGKRPAALGEMQQDLLFCVDSFGLHRNDASNAELADVEYFGKGKNNQTFGVPYCPDRPAKYSVRALGHEPDYVAISTWLNYCVANHPRCFSLKSDELYNTTLIDVNTKRLVKYRGDDYVALSYVWGGAPSTPIDRDGELPSDLPATIRDAITVVARLGLSYIWIDSICIDQQNEAEKHTQIAIMDAIYEGAIATLVALDGSHAAAGLAGVAPELPRQPQIIANFAGNKLVSRCPDFTTHIERSVWMTRGWTFQEGALSARCIFFTRHQVYFRCSEMFCSEDLHDSTSFGIAPTEPITEADDDELINNSVFWPTRNYLTPIVPAELNVRQRTDIYNEAVAAYVSRSLSKDSDALIAISALLRRFQRTIFPDGFLWGLPRVDLRNALLWREFLGYGLSRRRNVVSTRRTIPGLPSWSWVGWNMQQKVKMSSRTENRELSRLEQNIQPPLHIWCKGTRLDVDLIWRDNKTAALPGDDWIIAHFRSAWKSPYADSAVHIHQDEYLQEIKTLGSNFLLVEGVILSLPCLPADEATKYSFLDNPHLSVAQGQTWYGSFTPNTWTISPDFLLLFVKIKKETVIFKMVVLTEGSVASRIGIAKLRMKHEHVGPFLDQSQIRRKRFWWG